MPPTKAISAFNVSDQVPPPKKPLTAFFVFKSEVTEEVRKNNPNKRLNELMQIVGKLYHALSEEERKKYDDRALQFKCKYIKDVVEWEKTHGSIQSHTKNNKRMSRSKRSPNEKCNDETTTKSDNEEESNMRKRIKQIGRHKSSPEPLKR